jgi:protein-disulfide isomerase
MRRRLLGASVAAAMLAIVAAPAVAQPAPAAATADWTRTISRTPEGGMRMGNPDAPVRLVEYASISCPHCAAFAAERGTALAANYVRSGQVSWEYRPFLIFPTDAPIVQLLMCGDDRGFFQRVDRLYASQEQWSGRVTALPDREQEALAARVGRDHSLAIVRTTGLDGFFRDSGLDDMAINACLSDEAALDRLWQRNDEAMQRDGVQGTPTFLINGEMQDAIGWAELEPALRSSLEPDT